MAVERWKKLNEAFHAALELDPAERSEFLKRIGDDDNELRHELQLLLECAESMSDRRLSGTSELNAHRWAVTTDDDDPLVNTDVGPYRITRKLGHGGFGTVYRAERTTGFEQNVAIKLLNEEHENNEVISRRFEVERQVLSDLKHEYIARLVDGGTMENGRPFVVMEYVQGRPITAYCDSNRLTIRKRLELFQRVCRAVSHAHERAVVHRDIKPGNILVTDDGTPKLLDFGIAKLLDVSMSSVSAALTQTGQLPLTPDYASPEQIRGESVQAASDIYSLGVLLHELLSGRRPFSSGRHSSQRDVREIYRAVANKPSTVVCDNTSEVSLNDRDSPLAMSISAARSVEPDQLRHLLRGDLDNIVMMALRREPERRYTSADEFANDIQRYFELRPVAARPDSLGYRTAKFARRNRVSLGFSAALLVSMVIGAWGVIAQRSRLDSQQSAHEVIRRIQRLHADGHSFDAYELLRSAIQQAPDNPAMLELREKVSTEIAIETDPVGAHIQIRPIDDLEVGWMELTDFLSGETYRLAAWAFYHWKVAKPGYGEMQVLKRAIPGARIQFRLHSVSEATSGMVPVPGSHQVHAGELGTLDRAFGDFWIDQCEVTNREYQRFVIERGYENPDHWLERIVDESGAPLTWQDATQRFLDTTGSQGPLLWRHGRHPSGEEDLPVRGVSWYEAAAYARFVGKELPTLSHWYWAASAFNNQQAIVPLSNINRPKSRVWPSDRDRAAQRAGIGPYGTLDMAGNVKEWCRNADDENKRYILGGAWFEPSYAFGIPDSRQPISRRAEYGFRCSKSSSTGDSEGLAAPIPFYTRDYAHEQPCTDKEFEDYLDRFAYEKSPINEAVRTAPTPVDDSDFTVQTVEFDLAYSSDIEDRMIVYVYLPDERKYSPPYQSVIFFPGAYALNESRSVEHWQIEFLVKQGRAVIWPVYWGTYERRKAGFRSVLPRHGEDYARAITYIALDLQRSVDYLEWRNKDFDSEHIAYYGYSWGAAIGPIMLAVEPRIKAAVLHCGGFSVHRADPGVDQINFVPRVKADVLMLNGEYDTLFPKERSLDPMFNLLGKSIRGPNPAKELRIVPGVSHFVTQRALVEGTKQWIDQHLGKVKE